MAKRFQFRLESLYKFRQQKTDTARVALGQVALAKQEKLREIAVKNEYLESILTNSTRAKAFELQAKVTHIQTVKDEIKQLETELRNIEEIEALRRNELTRTMRDERVLEKLRDKKIVEHSEQIKIEEQNQLDEIALRRKSVF